MELPSKATHQATREHNVRLVLRALANLGPISRADIARRTQLTRTTVSDVVTQLSGAGLVQEVGRGPSSVRRSRRTRCRSRVATHLNASTGRRRRSRFRHSPNRHRRRRRRHCPPRIRRARV